MRMRKVLTIPRGWCSVLLAVIVCTIHTCLRTFALIVYAHPYCARNSCRNAMLRHARARAPKEEIYSHKRMASVALTSLRFNSLG